jgi:serine/threonine-protein kinase
MALGGRYRLIERIGWGGMSVVWRGQDAVLGRSVAIKVLAEGYVSDRAFRDRMRREAWAAARLSHPQVNTVFDLGEDGDSVPYMVMELIDGPCLAEELRRGPLPWRRAAAICADVAAGLTAAHAAGLVHRDVKPGNVMLGSTGAKLVDFGISAEIGEYGDRAHDGLVLGTPAYIAPERLTGSPAVPASDVYALGVLLFKAVTGRLPWDVDTKAQVLRAHLLSPPARLPHLDGIPEAVIETCERCLAKDPEDRPSAREVAHVWAHAVGRADEVTTLLGVPAPSGRTRNRRLRALVHGSLRGTLMALGVLALGTVAMVVDYVGNGAGTAGAAVNRAEVRAATIPVPPPCQVTYRLLSDDGHRFTGDLTVLNTGAQPIADQSLTFTVPGDQRVTGRTSGWTQSGAAVRVDPGTLAPGARQVLPFQGTYTASNALPGSFSLGGLTCDPVVMGIPGQQPTGTSSKADGPDPDKSKHGKKHGH